MSFVNHGALRFKMHNDTPLYDNVVLIRNHAFLGGGLYVLPSRAGSDHSESDYSLFRNISLLYNEANYGGGMCVAEGLVPPLFGSPLVIKHNSAHEMGGGMFVDTMEKDTIWLHGAVFENKYVSSLLSSSLGHVI